MRKPLKMSSLYKMRGLGSVLRLKLLILLIRIYVIVNSFNNTNLGESWHENSISRKAVSSRFAMSLQRVRLIIWAFFEHRGADVDWPTELDCENLPGLQIFELPPRLWLIEL
jgi:hypothetical protein